jgi:diazepam-binding inhibitor (GABA receptor modulator, acyl-CoA-binding protein)
MNEVATTNSITNTQMSANFGRHPTLTPWANFATVHKLEALALIGGSMSDLKSQFAVAAEAAKNLPKRPDDVTLLQLYALYKQSTEGDVQGSRPGVFDMVGRAKYDSWAKLKGTTSDDAMGQYIALVAKLGG